jgi:hypothetical protein
MSSAVTNQVASSAFKPSILYMNSCVNFFHYVFISCLEHLGFNIYLRLINNMANMITCLRLRALANKMFVVIDAFFFSFILFTFQFSFFEHGLMHVLVLYGYFAFCLWKASRYTSCNALARSGVAFMNWWKQMERRDSRMGYR